jgi:hypothetical protein
LEGLLRILKNYQHYRNSKRQGTDNNWKDKEKGSKFEGKLKEKQGKGGKKSAVKGDGIIRIQGGYS